MPMQEDTLLGWNLKERQLPKDGDKKDLVWSFEAQPKWITRASHEIQLVAEDYYKALVIRQQNENRNVTFEAIPQSVGVPESPEKEDQKQTNLNKFTSRLTSLQPWLWSSFNAISNQENGDILAEINGSSKAKLKTHHLIFSLAPYKGKIVDISLRLLAVDGMEFEKGTFNARFLVFMTWAPEKELVEEWNDIDKRMKEAKDETWLQHSLSEQDLAQVLEKADGVQKAQAIEYAKRILGDGKLTRRQAGALQLGDLAQAIRPLLSAAHALKRCSKPSIATWHLF
eukprot:g37566.t1